MPFSPNLPKEIHVFERGWLSANNILFTHGEKTQIVDSSYCTHAAQTVSLVESILGPRPLDVLVNTHLHSDHCGGNAALQARYPDICTLIPPGQAAHVSNWDPVALTYLPTGQSCPQFVFTDTLKPGSHIQLGSSSWEIHSAQGHDPHSVIFFERSAAILISADALWENGFGVVFPELEGINAFAEVGATLDLIEQLKPNTVIPGHGRVFSYTPEIMLLARQKLLAFRNNPAKHATHAAKVLLKFKLLEVQKQKMEDFANWAETTTYLIRIQSKFFPGLTLSNWIAQLCEGLIDINVARLEGQYILNR